MKLVNLTPLPHPVVVVGANGVVVLTAPPSGTILRLSEITVPVGEIQGVPVVRKTLDPAAGLPPREEGTFYIVSLPVAQATRREDFLVPDDLVRDQEGRVLGCRRFAIV